MTNQEYYEKLQEAYEYRKLKRVGKMGECPTCGGDSFCTTYDYIDLYNYCMNCGQALDWTDHPWNKEGKKWQTPTTT